MSDFQELQDAVVTWANGAHPERTPASTLLKLFEELGEVVSAPGDASEYADAFIVLIDVAHQHGITGDQLLEAIKSKMAINIQRKWKIDRLGIMAHE